jgi:hypothetical protein
MNQNRLKPLEVITNHLTDFLSKAEILAEILPISIEVSDIVVFVVVADL